MSRAKFLAACAAAVVLTVVPTVVIHAYSTYAKWSTPTVSFYVNPANADVPADVATTALLDGMAVWNTQSGTWFRFGYLGGVNDTTTGNDGRNVVMFRSAINGSAIASTYSWWSGTTLIDSDIVFWDGGFTFFGGESGCGGMNAAYIVDIAAHEFGHALGLNHSALTEATMYPSYSTCSLKNRTLDGDDIAAIQSLYPPTAPAPPPSNTAPAVTIYSPGNGSSFVQGASITFTGSANDAQDGDLTAGITWSSNLDGPLGNGGTFSRTLSVGVHVITANVTDSGGLLTSRQATTTVTSVTQPAPPPPTSSVTLTARPYKVKGFARADLSWKNLSATSVDVFRNGGKIMTTANDGAQTDAINTKGSRTYVYKVCAAGTNTCSNEASAAF